MKHRITQFILIVSCAITLIGCYETSDHTHVRNEVLEAFDSLAKAAKNLDTDAYFKHIDSERFSGLDAGGHTWQSIDDLRALIEPGFNAVAKVDSLVFEQVKVTVIDANNAILVNEFEQQLTLKNGEQLALAGGGVQVWHRSDKTWHLVSISASNKPR